MRTMAFAILGEAIAVTTAMGIVCVFPGMAPAKVTVAPNSPTAFAQERTTEAKSPFKERGRVIPQKAFHGEDPTARATAADLGEISSREAFINPVASPAIE